MRSKCPGGPHRHRDLVDEARLFWCVQVLWSEFTRYSLLVKKRYLEQLSRCRGPWVMAAFDNPAGELLSLVDVASELSHAPADRERLLCAVESLHCLTQAGTSLVSEWEGLGQFVEGRWPASFQITDPVAETALVAQHLRSLIRGVDVIAVDRDCLAACPTLVVRSALSPCPTCGMPHVLPGLLAGPQRVDGHLLPTAVWCQDPSTPRQEQA